MLCVVYCMVWACVLSGCVLCVVNVVCRALDVVCLCCVSVCMSVCVFCVVCCAASVPLSVCFVMCVVCCAVCMWVLGVCV